MKEKNKFYATPSTAVVELKSKGILCASEFTGGNSINDWGNGGTTNDELFL